MSYEPLKAKVGDKLRHADGYLYHVRGIVDGRYVCRFWSKYKQRWGYEVFDPVRAGVLLRHEKKR